MSVRTPSLVVSLVVAATASAPAMASGAKEDVCHHGFVIEVSVHAVPAHVGHGDHVVGDEVCDGIDNDCDGSVDESGGPTWYADGDGDGFGDPSTGVASCIAPPGTVLDATDCDDSRGDVHPGAREVRDGVDQDCDGTVDEGTHAPLVGAWLATDASVGRGGFAMLGDADTFLGQSAANVGDLDEDGQDDVAVGRGFTSFGQPATVFVVDGASTGVIGTGDAFTTVEGLYIGDNSPGALLAAGDTDGDGHDEFWMTDTAIPNAAGQGHAGAVYRMEAPLVGAFETGADAGTVIEGTAAGDRFGSALDLGDVDADGDLDLVVGAFQNVGPSTGTGYTSVFLGPIADGSFQRTAAQATITGAPGVLFLGTDVRVADLDGDGLNEVWTSARSTFNSGAHPFGKVYGFEGVSGTETTATADMTIASVAASDGFGMIDVGDLNGDGWLDLAVGAEAASFTAFRQGAVYVFYGPIDPGTTTTAGADLLIRGRAADDRFGGTVATADANGDGISDLVVGAFFSDLNGSNSGAVSIFYGPLAAFESALTADATVIGATAGDTLGIALEGAGDLDGDGADDLLLGANNGNEQYLVPGAP